MHFIMHLSFDCFGLEVWHALLFQLAKFSGSVAPCPMGPVHEAETLKRGEKSNPLWFEFINNYLIGKPLPIYNITDLLARIVQKYVPHETAACWQIECTFTSGPDSKTICYCRGVTGHFKHSFVHLWPKRRPGSERQNTWQLHSQRHS